MKTLEVVYENADFLFNGLDVTIKLTFNAEPIMNMIADHYEYDSTDDVAEDEIIDWFENNLGKNEYYDLASPETINFIDQISAIVNQYRGVSVVKSNEHYDDKDILNNILMNNEPDELNLI